MTSPFLSDVVGVLMYNHAVAEAGGYSLFVFCARCYVDQYDWVTRYYMSKPHTLDTRMRAWSISKNVFGKFSQHCNECHILIHRGTSKDIAVPSEKFMGEIMLKLVTSTNLPPSSAPVLSIADRDRIISEDLFPPYPDICCCPECEGMAMENGDE